MECVALNIVRVSAAVPIHQDMGHVPPRFKAQANDAVRIESRTAIATERLRFSFWTILMSTHP